VPPRLTFAYDTLSDRWYRVPNWAKHWSAHSFLLLSKYQAFRSAGEAGMWGSIHQWLAAGGGAGGMWAPSSQWSAAGGVTVEDT
jgi:hypothetical protein